MDPGSNVEQQLRLSGVSQPIIIPLFIILIVSVDLVIHAIPALYV